MLDTIKSWLRQITEVGLLLIAAAIVLEVIFGSAVSIYWSWDPRQCCRANCEVRSRWTDWA